VNIWGDTLGYINCWGSDGLFPDTCDQTPSGIEFQIFLRWADWDADPADMIDYDLFLVKWVETQSESGHYDWMVVAESMGVQSDTGEPTEQIIQYTSTGDPTYYGVFTALWGHDQPAGNFVNLDLFTPFWGTGRLRHYRTPRSLSGGMSESEDSVTVTAVDVNSPYAQETYSSEGPRNGQGGTADPPGVNKPNIAGYANVSTQTYGPSGFPGTSSATPHVAGAAALVVGAYTNKTLVEVQQFLEWRAKDLGTSGWDTVYGHGRVHLGGTRPIRAPRPWRRSCFCFSRAAIKIQSLRAVLQNSNTKGRPSRAAFSTKQTNHTLETVS
jgi:subtilisin family serine protease